MLTMNELDTDEIDLLANICAGKDLEAKEHNYKLLGQHNRRGFNRYSCVNCGQRISVDSSD